MTQQPEVARLSADALYVTHLLSCALTGAAPLPLPEGASWEGRLPACLGKLRDHHLRLCGLLRAGRGLGGGWPLEGPGRC